MDTKKEIDQEVLDEITKAIQQISYGEVVIVVHNSKIVQLEKREKKRFIGKGGDVY
ncbi:YezD family protein [Thermodesulfovibrionales bacterium]|nr:YezD family protein [Thermodesulfovibrionales bacterium]